MSNLPEPNVGGTDWGFKDPAGNEFVISFDGSVSVEAADYWTDLSPYQWGRIAKIAAHFATKKD